MELIILLITVLGLVHSYPNGAPPGICSLHPEPKHGFHKPQTSSVPYDIAMSQDHITSLQDVIRVTIKTRSGGEKFKGFLVLATSDAGEPIGTWENDEWSHPLSCGATTHDKSILKDVITLTWKPLVKVPSGKVHMKAVIVQKFDTYWTEIPVSVSGASSVPSLQKPSQFTEAPPKALSTTKSPTPPKGGVALPGLIPGSTASPKVSSTPGKLAAPTTTTQVPTTTKRRSLINRLFGGGGQSSTPTTQKTTTPKPTTTTTTTTPKPTTTTTTTTPKPTTTPTTKKPGFFSGLFGGKATTKPTTTTTTTTTTTKRPTTTPTNKAPPAQVQQAQVNNEGSINIPSKDVELISTTTKKSGLRRIFG